MKGIKNDSDGKKSLHSIRRNGKTPYSEMDDVVSQTSEKRLGDWADHQLEVVADKHRSQSSATWNVEEHRYTHGT